MREERRGRLLDVVDLSWVGVELGDGGLGGLGNLRVPEGGNEAGDVALDVVGLALEVPVDAVEEVIRCTARGRDGQLGGGKHVLRLEGIAEVDGVAGGQQEELVEELKRLGRRLVDDGDDGPASLGQLSDGCHHVIRRGRVQTGRGLVQEEQRWRGDELATDGHATALSAGDPAQVPVADVGVANALEPELVNHRIDNRHLVRGDRKTQPRREQ